MTAKTLRDYQVAAIESVREELRHRSSTLLVLPTGTGKTVVMAKLATGWERGNVLLLAHRVELLNQAAEKLGHELGYLPVVEQAGRGMDVDCLWQGGAVLVGSVQTLRNEKRAGKFRRHPFDLILVDEAHHATASSYRVIIDYFRGLNPGLKVLGVTATPRRADETALGIVFDSVAYQMEMLDAIEAGWLVPVEQEYITGSVNFDRVGEARNDHGESDLKASDLEDVLTEEEPLHALARPILDRCGDTRQCLVFTCGVAHAHLLAAVLNRYRSGSARAVDGRTLEQERKEVVDGFSRGEIQFLCNYGVFTEGFDVPAVSVVAMGRPTKSLGLYTQMLGRGTRPLPGVVDGPPGPEARKAAIAGSAKPGVLALDFVGNSRHKLVSTVDVLGGQYDAQVRDLAAARIRARPGANVREQLAKARAQLLLEQEQERRKCVRPDVTYSSVRVDPFARDGDGPAEHRVVSTRGGSSDAQIGFLVSLGVEHATAAAYTRRQASAVIDDLKRKRCTKKQKAILEKYGEDVGVNFYEASEIIDEIASSGWRPRSREGVPS